MQDGKPTVHVIGAGLSGLAAALAIEPATRNILVHEAARHAGGRCRSYYDATLKLTIDNGNHLVLSGNQAVQQHVRTIGAEDKLTAPDGAAFDFADLATGERWQVRPNAGPVPWWIFVPSRRVPGTRWYDYLGLASLMRAKGQATIGETMRCEGLLYDRLWHPLLVAALNTEPRASSAVLAGAVIRESLARGGAACRPLIAADGLGEAFIDPALTTLAARGVTVGFDRRLRRIDTADGRVTALDFGDETITLSPGDQVILSVPAPVAALLLPGLRVPTAFRSIANAHFLIEPPAELPGMLGMINSTAEWLFRFPGRLSVTVSDADRLLEMPREDLARLLWLEVAKVTGLPETLPPWQIIREKRATFAALPEQDALRPGAVTHLTNLFLAGDWTATGLPATIEGSLRSGAVAATAALAA
ncbi:hydroxysqualene dehydroxylase HpnE [Lichenihabitans psoromatis]|uniref:hydroxysqualene dehydroxylase HpnE n=1 Tax=Lichenihabitans psoromatis TaxID=2528642 RepID=UPI00103849F6|nr:hydroxysqualene dehydroxylase HpnE [Lichenihabitans psoromatis]